MRIFRSNGIYVARSFSKEYKFEIKRTAQRMIQLSTCTLVSWLFWTNRFVYITIFFHIIRNKGNIQGGHPVYMDYTQNIYIFYNISPFSIQYKILYITFFRITRNNGKIFKVNTLYICISFESQLFFNYFRLDFK